MSDEKNLLGVIGMCRRAGKAVIGTPMICEHLRSRGVMKEGDEPEIIVFEASDTSENTHKRISDKCIYYNVKHIRLTSDCVILGNAVGKNAVAAVAVADKNFCRAVLLKLSEDK